LRITFSISSVIVRSWRNQLARLVGGNPVVLALCAIFAVTLLVLWSLTVREFILPLFGGFSADTNMFVSVNSLLLTNISLVASLFLGIFLMLSPPRTALDNLLAFTPTSQGQRTIGYLLPLVGVTMTAIIVLYAPVVFSLVYGGAALSTTEALLVAYLYAGHGLYAVLLDLILYLLVAAPVQRIFAAGHTLSQLISVLITVTAALATTAMGLRAVDPLEGDISLHHLNVYVTFVEDLASKPQEPGPDFYLMVLAVPVMVSLLLWLLLCLVSRLTLSTERPRKRAWLGWLPFGRFGPVAIYSQELKQAIRHTENQLFAGFFLLLSAVALVAAVFGGADIGARVVGLPLIVWVMSALFSHNSYGRTRSHHWLASVSPRRRFTWLAAKVLANLTFSGGLAAALFFVLSFAGGGTSLSAYFATLPYGVLLILALTLLGTVLPYSEEYPFSSAFSALFGVFAGVPLSYVLQKSTGIIPRDLMGRALAAAAGILVLAIYSFDSWRTAHDSGV
jgi:hypothetical protein